MPKVRGLQNADADAALTLYTELTYGPPAQDPRAFHAVLTHPGTQVFGAFDEENLLGMVTLHVLPNVTWGGRSYALIENVIVTKPARGRGVGRHLMEAAISAAWAAGCFKIMLMTGAARNAAGFYEAVGFSRKDKDAMVIRRDP